jgi:hypothetical protein
MIPTVKIKSTHPASQGPFVEINETDFDPAKHERYDAPQAVVAPPPVLDPPPPPPANPLDLLPENWREAAGRGITKLKEIAEAATGRTPADKNEAVAMIEAALAERAAKNAPTPILDPPPPPPV